MTPVCFPEEILALYPILFILSGLSFHFLENPSRDFLVGLFGTTRRTRQIPPPYFPPPKVVATSDHEIQMSSMQTQVAGYSPLQQSTDANP
jgi:hypothetical protein